MMSLLVYATNRRESLMRSKVWYTSAKAVEVDEI